MSTTLVATDDDADEALATRPASNVFGAVVKRDAAVETESQRAIAEVQAAMVIAQKFPRDQVAAMDRILNACTRPSLAETAMYTFARGGTTITGPSIRLAEAIAQQWGNMKFGIRELEQRAGTATRNGESTVEAFAWDVETNTLSTKTFQVPHVRHSRAGQTKLTDPRDIYELVANNGARRLRACILAVIPGDVTENAVRQCEATLRTRVEITPERLQSLVEKFEKFGVTKKMLETRIQRRLDAIVPAQVVQLGNIYNSLNDGMSAAADWFEIEAATEGATPVTARGKLAEAAAKVKGDAGDVADKTDEQLEAEALAKMSGPELTKFLKAEAARLKIDEDELEALIGDNGGWAKVKSKAVEIVAKLRERAEA
jgi:hypothetical protein